ncbi:helix-turn-helix domain-containing protein [Allorhizobium undicola]|uniref:helix-turn-helix domain-containing protein n=1 Tax=Allorhizobium undicola TaxID=78527 RepID=UPI003D3261DA
MSYQTYEDDSIFSLSEDEEAAAEFIGELGREYQRMFLLRKFEDKITQQKIAERLGVNRSMVNRNLLGSSNMTAETMAKLAWAMDCKLILKLAKIEDLQAGDHGNFYVFQSNASAEADSATRLTSNVEVVRYKATSTKKGRPSEGANAYLLNDAGGLL